MTEEEFESIQCRIYWGETKKDFTKEEIDGYTDFLVKKLEKNNGSMSVTDAHCYAILDDWFKERN